MMQADAIDPTEEELARLVDHRFPGGHYRIEHWENWLLTDCTGRRPMPDDLVHPIVLFHAPILGAGTSIGELFRLGRASGQSGSVGLIGYDWEYLRPLREEVDHRVEGGIVRAERRTSSSGAVDDVMAFRIEMADAVGPVARVTNTWRFRRVVPTGTVPVGSGSTGGSMSGSTGGSISGSAGGSASGPQPTADGSTTGPAETDGDGLVEIPPWEMASVDAARMRTMAAILRDPYPVHWDRAANERLGLGGRVVNQGPLNLGYVVNMLMDWAGPTAVRRLTVSFGPPVLDGDRVIARGRVREVVDGIAHCDVWLERDGAAVVTGTAEVVDPAAVT